MVKKTKRKSPAKKKPMLVSVAESIGSTLGAIAAKTSAAQKALRKRKHTRNPAGKEPE